MIVERGLPYVASCDGGYTALLDIYFLVMFIGPCIFLIVE